MPAEVLIDLCPLLYISGVPMVGQVMFRDQIPEDGSTVNRKRGGAKKPFQYKTAKQCVSPVPYFGVARSGTTAL